MATELKGQTTMTIEAGGRSISGDAEGFPWDRAADVVRPAVQAAAQSAAGAPPSWEELSESFARVETIRTRIKVAKDEVADLMEDIGLVEAQDRVKTLKEDLKEAEGIRDELGRKMRSSRVDTFTGEVRG